MTPLTQAQAARFSALCSVILPASGQMPAAGALDLAARELGMVRKLRPASEAALLRLLARCPESVTPDWFDDCAGECPEDCRQVVILVCAAYYLHPEVRRLLNYPGQQALTLPRGGFGQEELVIEMMSGPKRYRPAD